MSAEYPFITGIIIIVACVVGMVFANRAARKKKDKRLIMLTVVSGSFAFAILVFMVVVFMLDAI
jgi:hypothetical protein